MHKNKVCVSKKSVYISLPLILVGVAIALYVLSLQKLSSVQTSSNTRASEICEEGEVWHKQKCVTPSPEKKITIQSTSRPSPTPYGYCPSDLPTTQQLREYDIPFVEYDPKMAKDNGLNRDDSGIFILETFSPGDCKGNRSVFFNYGKVHPTIQLAEVLNEAGRYVPNSWYDTTTKKYNTFKIYVWNPTYKLRSVESLDGYDYVGNYPLVDTITQEACDISHLIKYLTKDDSNITYNVNGKPFGWAKINHKRVVRQDQIDFQIGCRQIPKHDEEGRDARAAYDDFVPFKTK